MPKKSAKIVALHEGTRPEPPAGFGSHGVALWRTITAEYVIDDAAGLEILRGACEAIDRAETASQGQQSLCSVLAGRMKRPRAPRRHKFSDEVLDLFETCEAMREAGADSYEACLAGTPEHYAFQDLSKRLQVRLLGLPFNSICGGTFETEPEPPEGGGDLPMYRDWKFYYCQRQRLLAALDARRRGKA